MKRLLTFAVVAALFAGEIAGAQTTRPNERNRRPAAGGGETALFDRLQERLAELNLTDDQKKQIESLKDSVAETVRGMAGELKDMTPDERREKIREAVNAREKLMAILTPEQRAKLRGPGNRRAATSRPTQTPATKPAESPAAKAIPSAAPSAASQPAVGQPAPAFTLRRLNGNEATNKTFTGKPLVLVFGSLTSPSFRDRVPKLLDLKKKYASRANVLVVYTREAHPSNGWQVERNRDDKVVVAKPTTDAERMTLAKQLRDRFGPELDVLVDDLGDTTLAAFGDNADGAVVIAPYGQIVGTQKFTDASGLPRLIDEALKTR